ncbi:NAD(P)-binding protein [Penicillium chermesinum]|uniref:NAD(P)-binding protein n=1 Tax=Penicillium chermesinum TaxID=63820 RepID=A0A9W9TKC5_9EURO|nr:NAD(P)-binding protein [Penicillium chermesinum]KAJ5225996.1 NAD(P)-binding protein [Penicillium chermesinum]KAJ6160806.1 NAD(P)-binding protein [Penicillium chermesinum]
MVSHVAIAGATGNLGFPILNAILEAGCRVTVLPRIGGNSSELKPHPNLTIKEADFLFTSSLTLALDGVEVVVPCLATLATGAQNPLINAAVAAGVTRFILAEFGMNSTNPYRMALPVCEPKVATYKYLLASSEASPHFTFTGIANGLFLDWCLQAGIILDLKHRSATLYNGGDVPFTTTTLADVARGVLGVIEHLHETKNQKVYIQSAGVTPNQLIGYAKEYDGGNWTTMVKSTEILRQESLQELAKGPAADIELAMLGFCIVASWSPEYSCDFSSHLDNELLGIRGLNKKRHEEVRW